MSPFDPRSIIFAKHAQHVVLVHFPIALCMVGLGFDAIAQWRHNRALTQAAYYNLLVAAISTIPVLASGLLAWHFQLQGQRLKGKLLMHLVLGSVATCMIWIVWGFHHHAHRRPERKLPLYRWPIQFAAAAVVAVTAHLGGFLSGVNG